MLDLKIDLNMRPDTETKCIILWSRDHAVAKDFYTQHIQHKLGFEWATIDVSLGCMPAWNQLADLIKISPWCLSLTPAELFLGEYEYGVSEVAKRTHEQQIKQWIATEQVHCLQIDDVGLLTIDNIRKYEQW